MTRRSLLVGAVGVGTAAISYPCFCEPRWLEVTSRPVKLARVPLRSPIRLLHLSDFHASFVVPLSMIQNAITLGVSSKPDVICITGDFITFRHDFDSKAYASALRRLSAVAPAYAVLGNHDGGSWAWSRRGYQDHSVIERILEDGGVRLLHNRSERISIRDEKLTLAGVGDLWSREIDGHKAFAGVKAEEPIVLLSHNPDSKEKLGSFPWDLMLCGHTHGGQVIVPLEGTRYTPVKDKRYVAGLKPWGTRQIHVTRGVGNVGGVRFRCRPEVSVLAIA